MNKMKLETVEISINENSYNIEIGNNFLSEEILSDLIMKKEVLLVHDKNIPSTALNKIESFLKTSSSEFLKVELEASEENKSQASIDTIHNLLLEKGFSRQCVLVGLGGGIICDLCGFAAATYQRGVDFLLIPTTLLAQVDASVGGKTAINHPKGKNMIGAFHQPVGVIADTSFLKTLPEREISCGLSEMIKHGLINDINYFCWLEENIEQILRLEAESIEEAIGKSIEIKTFYVKEDEKEADIRALLNFGHTFGHAIELMGEFKDYNHGEAVAIGMILALELSARIGNISKKDCLRVRDLIDKAKIDTKIKNPINPADLYKGMMGDKKKKGDILNLVVLEDLGNAKITSEIDESLILDILNSSL